MSKKIRIFNLDLSTDEKLPDLQKNHPWSEENIVVCDQLSSVKVLSLCLEKSVNHIVQKSNTNSDLEIRLSSTMILSPKEFMKYPLSLILGEESPSEQTEKDAAKVSFYISELKDKQVALQLIENFVTSLSKRSSLASDIHLVADELITNSIFNAPYVDLNNSGSGIARNSTDIKIDPTRKPYIFAGQKDDRIVIGCTDFYGRLNIKKMIERIQKCYIKGPGEMVNFGPGGAGIGSFMIFESCVSFYLAVDADKSTTVGCAFPLKMSTQDRLKMPKNLHIIFSEANP